MYQSLGTGQLKTGETVELGVIMPPEPASRDKLHALLGHKGWEWVWQVDEALDGNVDTMETRFYVAKRGDEFISNVCTFEYDGVGLLGHVWTPETERRKGLCSRVFDVLMPDFKDRGGKLMLLGTGFDTPPYHIYRRYGFEGYYDGSGLMRWALDENVESRYFRRADNRVVEPTWSAYARVNALVYTPEEYVKSIRYGKFYMTTVEDAWIYLMHARAQGEPVMAKLLESEKTRAITGFLIVSPDRQFPGTFLADLYCHPNHTRDYRSLLSAIDWPDGKVLCYVESANRKKAQSLKAAGFVREGTLKEHLVRRDGTRSDVYIFARAAK